MSQSDPAGGTPAPASLTADLLPPAAPEPMKFYLTGRVLVLDGVHYRPRVEYTGSYGHGPSAHIAFDLTLRALDSEHPEVEGELVLSMPWGVGGGSSSDDSPVFYESGQRRPTWSGRMGAEEDRSPRLAWGGGPPMSRFADPFYPLHPLIPRVLMEMMDQRYDVRPEVLAKQEAARAAAARLQAGQGALLRGLRQWLHAEREPVARYLREVEACRVAHAEAADSSRLAGELLRRLAIAPMELRALLAHTASKPVQTYALARQRLLTTLVGDRLPEEDGAELVQALGLGDSFPGLLDITRQFAEPAPLHAMGLKLVAALQRALRMSKAPTPPKASARKRKPAKQ